MDSENPEQEIARTLIDICRSYALLPHNSMPADIAALADFSNAQEEERFLTPIFNFLTELEKAIKE